jgi:hypothetical protein
VGEAIGVLHEQSPLNNEASTTPREGWVLWDCMRAGATGCLNLSQLLVEAPPDRSFNIGSVDLRRWPQILSRTRWTATHRETAVRRAPRHDQAG